MSFCKYSVVVLLMCLLQACAVSKQQVVLSGEEAFSKAKENADLANEGFKRADRYIHGWLIYPGFVYPCSGGRHDVPF